MAASILEKQFDQRHMFFLGLKINTTWSDVGLEHLRTSI